MNEPTQYDIIFCSLPPLGMDRIYSAPPILKGVVESAGYCSRCFDFANDFFKFCDRDLDKFGRLSNYFIIKDLRFDPEDQDIIDRFYQHIIDTVTTANSRYIAFSVFSSYTHKIAVELLIRLQAMGLDHQVVFGGRGMSAHPAETIMDLLDIKKQEVVLELVDIVSSRGFKCHVIVGDGEEAVLKFLQQGFIDRTQHSLEILQTHLPNYDDYDFDSYVWHNGQVALDVVGSVGCVRDCDFCDIKKQFGGYKFKSGSDLVKELIKLQKHFGINKFVLTDSLSNGGLKIFREFMNCLAEYNASAETPIIWSGQYICRDLRNLKDIDDYYRSMALSGAQGLTIGAESGSNHVLNSMDKKTTVEALFFELEQFRKWGITCTLLTFCGHWSERHEDFVDHCIMLLKCMPYVRSGTISVVELGGIFSLIPGSPASRNINLITDPGAGQDFWLARNNRGNTFKVRLQQRLIISILCDMLRLGVELAETQRLQTVYTIAENYCDQFNEFFTKHAQNDYSRFESIKNIPEFIDEILGYKKTMDISLEIESHSCNGNPDFTVAVNGITIYHNTSVAPGTHVIELEINCDKLSSQNQLSLSMSNKKQNDTEVDSNGNIIKDKNILLKNIVIDDCDLINDFDFFYKNFYYSVDGARQPGGSGLWSNQSLCLDFDKRFVYWYSKTSTKNQQNDQSLRSQTQTQGLHDKYYFYEQLIPKIEQLKI